VKKIPTMFERDWEGDRSRVLDKPNPEAAWVFAGEGVATRKYDGMACMYDGERWFKRREVKANQHNPADFIEVEYDRETLKRVGWVPIGDGPEDRHLREATHCIWDAANPGQATPKLDTGTYEFVGPKSQGGVEGFPKNSMMCHATAQQYLDAPRTFDALREWLAERDIEGVVFHHPDGRMAKIKKRDFGLKRTPMVPR
jgi:hypothetical protein